MGTPCTQTEWDLAIGRLVRSAVATEAAVTRLTQALGQLDGPLAGHFLPRDVPAMAELVRELLRLHLTDRQLITDVLDWLHQVVKVHAAHAAVLHARWEPAGAVLSPVWARPGTQVHPMTPADVDRLTTAFRSLGGQAAQELLLRIDKIAPELGVFTRI